MSHFYLVSRAIFALLILASLLTNQGFPGGSMMKDTPANGGDVGSIPGLGNPLEKEMATVVLPEKTHVQKSLERLQSMGWQRVEHDFAAEHSLTKEFRKPKYLFR